jgi:Divergent InlB B-repeat domain
MPEAKTIGKIGVGLLLAAGLANAEFSLCKFNFGVDWSQHIAKNCSSYRPNCSALASLQIPAGVDFIASFVGWTQDGDTKLAPAPKADKEGAMITDAKALSATPVWYSYIIAEGAKTAKNLTDCNVGGGSGTLCTEGANYIRANKSTILSQYTAYATFAASKWGTSKPMIWALEPDFVQYTEAAQNGGGLSNADAKQLLSDIADAITAKMPNAWISMDISPWKDQSAWINGAVPLTKFKFMNTSGGVALPGATIKDNTSWSTVWGIAKKGMIADDGYGAGGTATNPNSGWSDVSNLNARINDGVVALMEALPGTSWGNTISGLRPQLNQLKTCSDGSSGTGTAYTLSVDAGANGKVTVSPDQVDYASGTTVQLTAVSNPGYQFSSWSGDASGTSNPLSIKLTKSTSVTAVFVVRPLPQYKLAISTSGAGSVTTNPSGTATSASGTYLFDSGITVKMTAVPTAGKAFVSWGGDVSGTLMLKGIQMLQDHKVTATFTGSSSIGPRATRGERLGLLQGKLLFDASGMGTTRLELVDVHGRRMPLWQGTSKDAGQVSLEGLPSGLYFVALKGETETVRQTIQLVR